MVAFGEQTVPSGITALLIAMMPVWVAIFGRIFFGERLPRLAVVGIVVGFVGVAILVGPSRRRQGALEPIGPGGDPDLADRVGERFAVRVAPGRLPRPAARRDRVQMVVGGCVLLVAGGRHRRVRRRFDIDGRLAGFVAGDRLPDDRRQPARLHGLRLDAPRRAAAARRDVRLRQPCRRGHPRLRHPGEAIEPRTLVAGAVIVAAVALIVTARGRMQAPHSTAVVEALEAPSPTTSATSRATTR